MTRQHHEEQNKARLEAKQARHAAETTQRAFDNFLAYFNNQQVQAGSFSQYIPSPMYCLPPSVYTP